MSTLPRRIAVASGKGGVGKTWLSVSLATALAGAGRSVLLVDCDLGLANVDVQLGLSPTRDLGDVIAGEASVADIACRYAEGAGFDVAAGRAGSGSLASLPPASIGRLMAALDLASGYDVVVLDLGAGVDAAVRRLAAWADTLLVIATADPTSLTDAYVVLKLLVQDRGRDAGSDARIVINQATDMAGGRRTFETLERVSLRFLSHRPTLAGIVHRDERVCDAIRSQVASTLRFPNAPSSIDVAQLSASLMSALCTPAHAPRSSHHVCQPGPPGNHRGGDTISLP